MRAHSLAHTTPFAPIVSRPLCIINIYWRSLIYVKTRFDAGNKSGKNVYWKSSFLEDLSDEFIDSVVKLHMRAPEGTTIEVCFFLQHY